MIAALRARTALGNRPPLFWTPTISVLWNFTYMRDHPELFTWRGPRNLSIRIEPLLRDLELERIERVGINLLSGVPRFTYRSGKTALPQQVVVRSVTGSP